jgi:DNA-binding NarL/FixJ family response regulator
MSTSSKIKILIVEDYKKIAEAWSDILTKKGYDVVGICSGEEQALNKVEELNPDIVLMDINLQEGNGLGCTKSLKSSLLNCKVIALSMYNDQKHLEEMVNAGALGYVTKNSSVKEILLAIESVLKGGTYICEEMRSI